MSLVRIALCVAIGWGIGVAPVVSALAADVGQEFKDAEKSLEEVAETDPSHPDTSTDPLSFDPDLAVWTLVVFVVLLAVLWKFAWGPITAGLDKREHGIADNIAAAQRQHEEAKAALAQYEAKLDSATDEVRKILDEARRDAEHVKQTVLAEAKSGAEAERLRALREIEAATDAALQSLAERSAKLAVDLAGKIVRTSLTPGEHDRLIQEAVEKFPQTSPSNN